MASPADADIGSFSDDPPWIVAERADVGVGGGGHHPNSAESTSGANSRRQMRRSGR